MAVFRVQKTEDYTVMSNYHLRDKGLSLKAKGLLSQMLSLPEDWDYTLAGLSYINKESKDAIRSAVKELETAGYVVRRQTIDEAGKFSTNEYIIYERPVAVPPSGTPSSDIPSSENPQAEKPLSENPTQLNTKKSNTEKQNTDRQNIDSLPIPSAPFWQQTRQREPKRRETMENISLYREIILENIEYDLLRQQSSPYEDDLDEIVELTAANALLEYKAAYFDTFVGMGYNTNLRVTAKELEVPERKFIRFLLTEGFVYRSPSGNVLPYAKSSNAGLFCVKEYINTINGHCGFYTLVTPFGKQHFAKFREEILLTI